MEIQIELCLHQPQSVQIFLEELSERVSLDKVTFLLINLKYSSEINKINIYITLKLFFDFQIG